MRSAALLVRAAGGADASLRCTAASRFAAAAALRCFPRAFLDDGMLASEPRSSAAANVNAPSLWAPRKSSTAESKRRERTARGYADCNNRLPTRQLGSDGGAGGLSRARWCTRRSGGGRLSLRKRTKPLWPNYKVKYKKEAYVFLHSFCTSSYRPQVYTWNPNFNKRHKCLSALSKGLCPNVHLVLVSVATFVLTLYFLYF